MTTITIPTDVEQPLAAAAKRKGTTPELLAVESLRSLFVPTRQQPPAQGATLFDVLDGYIGAVSGSTEPLSDECGRRFADGLIEKRQQGRL